MVCIIIHHHKMSRQDKTRQDKKTGHVQNRIESNRIEVNQILPVDETGMFLNLDSLILVESYPLCVLARNSSSEILVCE